MRILRLLSVFVRDFLPSIERTKPAPVPEKSALVPKEELPYFNLYLRCKRTSSSATVNPGYLRGETTSTHANLHFKIESVETYEDNTLKQLKPEMLSIHVSFSDGPPSLLNQGYSAYSLTRPSYTFDKPSPRNYRKDGIVIYIDMPMAMYQMVHDAEMLSLIRGYFMETRKDDPDGTNIVSASLDDILDRHAAIRFKSASFSKWEPTTGKKQSVKQLTENFVHREYTGTLDS